MPPSTLDNKPEIRKKSGSINLFSPGQNPHGGPYAYFKVCRGYIDDINGFLSIRLRIRLETQIAEGVERGELEVANAPFHWEFRPA